MTCGVNPIPTDPKASTGCFLPEPGGLPLAFLVEGDGDDGIPEGGGTAREGGWCSDGEKCTPGGGGAAAVGGGEGTRAMAMEPSGPYFLGLPLLRLTVSAPELRLTLLESSRPEEAGAEESAVAGWYGGEEAERGGL